MTTMARLKRERNGNESLVYAFIGDQNLQAAVAERRNGVLRPKIAIMRAAWDSVEGGGGDGE